MTKTLEAIMAVIDSEGRPLTIESWIDLLTEIVDQCQTRRTAAREDLAQQGRAERED